MIWPKYYWISSTSQLLLNINHRTVAAVPESEIIIFGDTYYECHRKGTSTSVFEILRMYIHVSTHYKRITTTTNSYDYK